MRRIVYLLLLAGIGYVIYQKFLGTEKNYAPEPTRDNEDGNDEPSY